MFVGIKDSAGQLANMEALVERFPGFSVLAGADPLMLPLLRKGGAGCITATSNLMAKDLAFIYRHFADAARAAEVEAAQARVVAERNRTAGPVQIAAIKALTAARTGERRLAPDAPADGAALGRAGGRLPRGVGAAGMQDDAGLVDALGGIVGRQHVVAADDDQEPYLVDWRGRYHGPGRGGGEAGEHGAGRGRGAALRRGGRARGAAGRQHRHVRRRHAAGGRAQRRASGSTG